jgi:glutaconate CoA-transferase subunit A
MFKKVMSMADAVDLIQDGQLLGIGGNALHRSPVVFTQALAKAGRKDLKVCAAAPGMGADVLCAAGCADTVYFGFFGFENEYGLAAGFRKGCQEGKVKAIEGS